jgi:cell division GTPase FtsZ
MTSRLKFAVIGLGQCGGNIANTFAKYGYPSMAINTSILDLKDLANIPDNRKIHAPLNDTDGAGKDPRIGEKAIQSHLPSIFAGIQQFVSGADAILITAGLGGGTGSNIALLGGMMKKLGLPIVVLSTIPTNDESALAKINALRAVNRIVSENFDSCILIDNAKILSHFPESSLAAFYPEANEYVVRTFTNFNSLTTEFASRCLISFDNEDFRKVLLSKGILIFGETELNATQINTLDDILPRLREIWQTSGLMAEGFNFATAASGAISIFAPAAILQKTSSRFLNLLGEEFKSLTNGATCYFGLYEMPNSSNIKISTMLGRLTIPVRLQEMLTEASSEGKTLNAKLQQELPQLDISALDAMELFSIPGTTGRIEGGSDTHILARDAAALAPAFTTEIPKASQPLSPAPSEGADLEDNKSYSLEEYVKKKKLKASAT